MEYFVENEIAIIKELQTKKQSLNKNKYTSRISEAQRNFVINKNQKLKINASTSANIIFNLCLRSIHKNLTVDKLQNCQVIKVSNQNKIDYLWVSEYIENQKLTFEFCSNNTWFTRTLICKAINKDQATKIIFKESVLAPAIIYGLTGNIEKKRYIKMQIAIFNYQILQIKNQFSCLKKYEKKKYDKISLKYQKLISKYKNFHSLN